jgi:beta-galactosidase
VGGTAWYRRHFTVNNSGGRQVSVLFDGVYMNSDVWVNGHFLGNHPYGYTPFYYNITSYLKPSGKQNTIAVRVRNEGRNSRWYSGSGIYRHVWLITTHPAHIQQWGVYITTPEVSAKAATASIQTTVENGQNNMPLTIKTYIVDAAGKTVAAAQQQAGNSSEVKTTIQLNKPHLWSPETPYLYTANTELWQNNQLVDKVATQFGVRSIEWSAVKGFLLNGQKVLLRGGCVHHDNGPLGAATIDRAEERKIELLKSVGYNAVRTSHNPPSRQFLDACDRLGMIVIDEAFDQWERPKNPQDYHLYFDTSWQKDIAAMVLRDRNHPSVIFWSIGNEVNERADSSGLRIAKQLRDAVKRLDATRPVTEAICAFWDHPGYKWDTTAAAFALLDVGGYNYQWREYQSDHAKYPERIMMGTESFPAEAYENWQQVQKHPYVIGDFVWTAMDYIGETGIGHTALDSLDAFAKAWPWFNAWCGDIDLIGGKKPQSYYRDIVWGRSKIEMLVHAPVPEGHKEVISYWGWPDEYPAYTFTGREGKPLQVHVYTQYPAVRLALNGKIIGEQTVATQARHSGISSPSFQPPLTATFTIPYQPGTLIAYGLVNGKIADSVILKTAGKPAQIQLTADRKQIGANKNDISYITATVLDADGNVVPDTTFTLHFSVAGNGSIIATANANPAGMESFQQPVHHTFRGKCLAIVQPANAKGNIVVKAGAAGLKSGAITIEVQ